MKKLTMAYLYPQEMNIYGDRGNVMVLKKRLGWRGIELKIVEIEPGIDFDFSQADLVFGGGGQDKGQAVIAADLVIRGPFIQAAANAGVPMLLICGTYQLFGHGFTTLDGEEIPGIGVFNMHTTGSAQRMIGNVVVRSPFGELVGFENHSGQTILEPDQAPLGTVLKGFGNTAGGKDEGALYKNVFGTYLHGPVLAKNPAFADAIITRSVNRRYPELKLEPLDDILELEAARVAKARP